MITLEHMLESSVHLGHSVKQYNPKMRPFIYGERNGIYIIDVLQTLICLNKVSLFLKNSKKSNKKILFVCTKKQFSSLIQHCSKKLNSFYITERWLGGMLTNWNTIKKGVDKLNLLLQDEQESKFLNLSKKEILLFKKKREKLEKYLNGIKDMQTLPDIVIIVGQKKEQEKKDSSVITSVSLFAFNPNIASKEELIRLGFSPYVASRLENYRNKGGKFIIKSDLLKLYGMDTALYSNLYTWIDLPIEKSIKKIEEKKEIELAQKRSKEKFDLNLADSSQLISVYGIGSKLSVRIIKYRDRLGGFITTDQLNEVYGLDSVVINEIKKRTFITENFKPKTVGLNTASEKELAAHPYIKYSIAKAVTAYRFQHGSFKSIDDLSKIAIIDKTTFEKIKPYLSLNP